MLPTFLGIGVPKAGTTWICDMLRAHPGVVMAHRKEVHYFDRNFEKGIAWYERFFSGPTDSVASAIGEFTTSYLYDAAVPARIRAVPSITRLILTLRNPVDRTLSDYRFRQQVDNYRGQFEEFLLRYPRALDRGRYATHLRPWLDEFDLSEILILVFEDATRDRQRTQKRLAQWLAVDPSAFPARALEGASNASFIPRHRRLYAAATQWAQFLRRHDLDHVIELGRRVGVKRVLSCGGMEASVADVGPDVRSRLWRMFEPEIDELEDMCGLDLSCWRGPGPAA